MEQENTLIRDLLSIHNQFQDKTCPVCNNRYSRKGVLLDHFIAIHVTTNNHRQNILGCRTRDFLTNPITTSLTQTQNEVHRQPINQGRICTIEKVNEHCFGDDYMIKLVKCLSNCRLSVNKFICTFSNIQKFLFDGVEIEMPGYSTISRHITAIEKTVDGIYDELISSSNNKITRAFDESDGHLIVYYFLAKNLNNQELDKKRVELEQLTRQQQGREKAFKYVKKKIAKLERELRLQYEQKQICKSMMKIRNLTAGMITQEIGKVETNFRRSSIGYTICDHGSSGLVYVRSTTSTLINCFGHVLNLVTQHFNSNLYSNFECYVGKAIRKLRSGWKYLQLLIKVDKSDPEFIEKYMENDVRMEFPANYEGMKDVNVPPEPVKTRWQTISKAAHFLHENFSSIYRAITYWQPVDVREENIQATYSDILDMCEDGCFIQALHYSNIFFTNFLDDCFKDLRTNNTYEYLYQYLEEWKQRLLNLTTDQPSMSFDNAKQAALNEFEKLTNHHKLNTNTFLASLANINYASRAITELERLDDSSFLNFDANIIRTIKEGTTTLFNHPQEVSKWVHHFGSVVLDNEIVEGCFSSFNHNTNTNRKNRGTILKLFHNNSDDWEIKLLTSHNHRYHQHLKIINTEGRGKRKKIDDEQEQLEFIREEKKRKVIQYGRRFGNEDYMDAVIYLFRVYSHVTNSITWTPSMFSTKILKSILQEIVSITSLTRDDAKPDKQGMSAIIHVFQRDVVKRAIRELLTPFLENNIHQFHPSTQHTISKQALVLDIDVEHETFSETSLTTHNTPIRITTDPRPKILFKTIANKLKKYQSPETTLDDTEDNTAPTQNV